MGKCNNRYNLKKLKVKKTKEIRIFNMNYLTNLIINST